MVLNPQEVLDSQVVLVLKWFELSDDSGLSGYSGSKVVLDSQIVLDPQEVLDSKVALVLRRF